MGIIFLTNERKNGVVQKKKNRTENEMVRSEKCKFFRFFKRNERFKIVQKNFKNR